MNLQELTKGERFIVDWQYRMAGSFKTALVEAIAKADRPNQANLAMGFPEEVKAYQQFANEEGWWENIQEKIGIKIKPRGDFK